MTETSSNGLKWYCVRAQPKREHIAAEHLKKLEEVEVFCPRIRYRKATRRGKIWWIEPLFPGYLLVKFDRNKHERTVTFCQGVLGLVRFGSEMPDIPEKIVHSLLAQITAQEGNDQMITVSPKINIGDEVEVADGPFKGMKGTIQTIALASERVAVLLEFLGQLQPVDLDLFSILLPSKPLPEL